MKEKLLFAAGMLFAVGIVIFVLLGGFRYNNKMGGDNGARAEIVETREVTEFNLEGQTLNLTNYKRRRNQIVDKYINSSTLFTDDDVDVLQEIFREEGRRGKIRVQSVDSIEDILREIKNQ